MSIDSCYEGVIAKLTSQQKIIDISAKLLSLKTDNERVLFVYKILEELNAFPNVKEVKKSNEQSLYYRNFGNQCFDQSKFHKAWQYYNLSLLNATVHSECYCLALSNRSAVFFELEKYNECIQDIDTVFSLQYPEKLTEKLNKRKESCVEFLGMVKHTPRKDNIKVDNILKIKSPKDPVYVAASNKLKVVYTEDMGRHVVAKEDISVGEVIVEEDPYFTILIKSQYLVACNYCMSRSLNLMPCDNCCFSLYCSNECKEKALKQYHEVECPLNATLLEMDFTKLELLALRTVIKARTDHSSWDELFKTIEEADSVMNTDFHGQVKVGDKWIYDSKYYASIHSLATNKERRSMSDIFQKAVTAVVFLRFLRCNTNFLQSDCEDEKEKILQCVARLLMIHEMTTPTNMHAITSNIEDQNGKCVEEINLGSAPYAFCSLINHSCAPNVVRFAKLGSGKMSVLALRPIKKGMQLFDNYGSHHAMEDRNARQKSLKFQYKFNCLCEACVNNWPTYMQLSMTMRSKVPNIIVQAKDRLLSMDVINQLQYGDLETALKIYNGLCQLCERLERYAPCLELCDCQESLKQCFVIFEGVVSYGSNLMVDNKVLSTESRESCTIA